MSIIQASLQENLPKSCTINARSSHRKAAGRTPPVPCLQPTLASSDEAPRLTSTSNGADVAVAGFSKETLEGLLPASVFAGPAEPRLARSDPSRKDICTWTTAPMSARFFSSKPWHAPQLLELPSQKVYNPTRTRGYSQSLPRSHMNELGKSFRDKQMLYLHQVPDI